MNACLILQVPHLKKGLIADQHQKIAHHLDRVHALLNRLEILLGMQSQILRVDVQSRQALQSESVVPHSLKKPGTRKTRHLFFVEGIY